MQHIFLNYRSIIALSHELLLCLTCVFFVLRIAGLSHGRTLEALVEQMRYHWVGAERIGCFSSLETQHLDRCCRVEQTKWDRDFLKKNQETKYVRLFVWLFVYIAYFYLGPMCICMHIDIFWICSADTCINVYERKIGRVIVGSIVCERHAWFVMERWGIPKALFREL